MTQKNPPEAASLQALTGHRLGPYISHNAVSATQIWQWCSVMGDRNPLYAPGEKQLAPPAMMQMWTMRDVNDRYAPGSTDAHPYQVFEVMSAMGYPANVAVSYDIDFYRYLHVGERPLHYTSVAAISERKKTALGEGYFVTEKVEYLTRHDEPFAEAHITYFQYTPAVAAGSEASTQIPASRVDGAGQESVVVQADTRQPDYSTLSVATLRVGDNLPELLIPITHRLIVAGAIATQDFTPVHHNEPVAKAAGMPDIFMNILTTCGLTTRYLTDWAGSGSRLARITFKLMAPNLPGDVMRLRGEVSAVTPGPDGGQVEVAFSGLNRLGTHISGTAILALPHTDE